MQKWLKSPKVWGIALAAVAIIAVVAGFFGLSSRTARMQDERQLLNDQLASAQEQLNELALQLEEKGRQSEPCRGAPVGRAQRGNRAGCGLDA